MVLEVQKCINGTSEKISFQPLPDGVYLRLLLHREDGVLTTLHLILE